MGRWQGMVAGRKGESKRYGWCGRLQGRHAAGEQCAHCRRHAGRAAGWGKWWRVAGSGMGSRLRMPSWLWALVG